MPKFGHHDDDFAADEVVTGRGRGRGCGCGAGILPAKKWQKLTPQAVRFGFGYNLWGGNWNLRGDLHQRARKG